MTRHEQALEQAQIDAHQAVKDLLDAIGRIVITHIENHQEQQDNIVNEIVTTLETRFGAKTPAPPAAAKSQSLAAAPEPPKPKHPPGPANRKRVLTDLHHLDQQDMPLDVADYPQSYEHQLRRLAREKLAKNLRGGLWRITLGGKAHLASTT